MKLVCLLLCLSVVASCESATTSPYEPQTEATRDTHMAEKLTRQAEAVFATDPPAAEGLLREALAADLFYGPAHNNLGLIYLGDDKLYEAANEFEWARKLLPGHPDPRLNLGITLERAGQVQGALDSFKSAIEVYPEHIPTLQALARLMASSGRIDDRYPVLLDTIALRGETEGWRRWAREQSLRRDGRD